MTAPFSATRFGSAIAAIIGDGTRLMPLGPGTPATEAAGKLRAFDPLVDIGAPILDADMARTCHALMWLYHDGLDPAHDICQEIDTTSGSFCHAIVHRREPDPSNSKYWLVRARGHAVLARFREQAAAAGLTYTTPEAFVDLCERVRGTNSEEEARAKRLQTLEWQLLFAHCFDAAARVK